MTPEESMAEMAVLQERRWGEAVDLDAHREGRVLGIRRLVGDSVLLTEDA
jgi:hypothetical protein